MSVGTPDDTTSQAGRPKFKTAGIKESLPKSLPIYRDSGPSLSLYKFPTVFPSRPSTTFSRFLRHTIKAKQASKAESSADATSAAERAVKPGDRRERRRAKQEKTRCWLLWSAAAVSKEKKICVRSFTPTHARDGQANARDQGAAYRIR